MPDGTGALEVVTSEVINAATSPVTINPSNGFVGEVVSPVTVTIGLNSFPSYKLKLQDSYVRLLSSTVTEVSPSFSGSGLLGVVYEDKVKSDSDPSLTFIFDSNPVTATDQVLLLAVTLANSTAL